MTRITVVSAPALADTGAIDFTYLHYAPEAQGEPWGLLALVDGAGSINPFRGMQLDDWSSPALRWNLNLLSRGELVIGAGIDFTDDASLAQLLKAPLSVLGNFSVLTVAENLVQLNVAAQMLGTQLNVHNIEAALATSGNLAPRG